MMINAKYQDILTNDDRAKEVAKEMLEKGFISFTDFLEPAVWQQLSTLMQDRSNGNKKGQELKGTIGYDLGFSDDIYNFSDRIHKARCELEGKPYVPLAHDKQVVGFPYKDARGGKKTEPTHYHFDGAYINLIIPIVLPADQEKNGGGVVLFPNIRKKYGTLLSKFICRGLRHSKLMRDLWGHTDLTYKIGACHVFFGDITFHGVDPITDGERIVMTINSHW